MAKNRLGMWAAAAISVSGIAGLLFWGVSCGSSGGGGAAGTGGNAGTGGAGGHAGTGGTGGIHDGGAAGSDGGGSDSLTDSSADVLGASSINFTFNSSEESFALETAPSTNPVNLGAGVDGGTAPTLAFDSSTGMPSPGSLEITATFTDHGQVVIVRRVFLSTQAQDLRGKHLAAQIRLDGPDGGSSSFTGLVHLFATSFNSQTPGQGGYEEGTSIGLTDHNWHALSFDLAHPEYKSPQGFDAASIIQIGLQILTPMPAAGDAATPAFGAPQSITIHFDSLVSQP